MSRAAAVVLGLLAACAAGPQTPGEPDRLVAIDVEGRSFWSPVATPAVEDHPCCGRVPVDPARLADAAAVCPPACDDGGAAGDSGCACPAGTHALRPGLADDPVCGAPSRCLRDPALRVVGADATLEATGEVLRADAPWRGIEPGPAGIVTLAIGETRERLLLSPGRRYTAHVAGGALVAVTVDGDGPR